MSIKQGTIASAIAAKSMTAARCEKLRGKLAPPTGDAGARQPVTNPPIIVDE